MSGTLIIGPEEDLIQRTAALLGPRRKDYSHNLVVFPGRRPAHFLRRELAQGGTGCFIPPVILSMDGFVDYAAEAAAPFRDLETVDAVAILYDIHRSSPKPLGGDSFLALDSFFSLGTKLFGDIEELCIEGVPPAMVREIRPFADETVPGHALARLQSLHFFYKNFYEKVSLLGLTTRSMRYRMAAGNLGEGAVDRFEKAIFAGFYGLTRSEKELFRKLLLNEKTRFIFRDGPGLGESLSELGIDRSGSAEPRLSGPEIHFYSSPDTHGQVFALGSILRDMTAQKGAPDERTAIVLPSSETLFPLLRHGMACIDKDDFNISLGYPMHRTPVFAFLSNLMELTASMEEDRVYVPDYVKFILHPYVKNIYYKGNAEVTRIMFHTIEETLQKSRTRTFATLQEIENNERIAAGIAERLRQEEKVLTVTEVREHLRMIHLNTIEKLLSFRDIGDFAKKCTDLLTFVFHNSTARLHPLFHPFSESFIRALDAASKCLLKGMSFADRTGYFTFFREYVMTGRVPFPGTPLKGVQVLGFLEARSIRFDTVCILDANEEVIPDTAKEDTLLPFKAREILKLPTYRDRDRLSAYYFDNLVRGAREVHIFFVENDTRERSRFVESLLWERQKGDRSTKARDYVKAIQYKVKLGNDIPAAIPKTDEVVGFLKEFTYSATALDIYLACPLRFYYRYVLELGKKEEISGEVEKADVGRFIHRVLSAYFSRRLNSVLREADINPEEMDSLIDSLFAQEYGENPVGAVYLLRAQIKAHLRAYLGKYRLPLIIDTNVSVISVEETVETTLAGHRLKGRLDAVEKRNGAICIVDYKSGAHATHLKINFERLDPGRRESWDDAIGSLQLPFYLILYSGRHGIEIGHLRGMFLLLGRSSINREIELPLFDADDGGARIGELKTIILGLMDEIVDPEVPFAAAPNRKKSCPGCDFRYICGTQWVTG